MVIVLISSVGGLEINVFPTIIRQLTAGWGKTNGKNIVTVHSGANNFSMVCVAKRMTALAHIITLTAIITTIQCVDVTV